jgi:hypothetical protein
MMRKRVIIIVSTLFIVLCTGIILLFSPLFKQNETKKVTGDTQEFTTKKNMQSVSPTRQPTVQITNTPTPEPQSLYPLHVRIFATTFWVGEDATDENDYIPNKSSAWDGNWLDHFGGIDNPYTREGYYPKGFIPKENPFYIALPYDDLNEFGLKASATQIPWYTPNVPDNYSFMKNRWVKLIHKGNICYAQIEDVGPFETDDFDYVFLNKKPKNSRAGIDLSPAVTTCLKMVTNSYINWQFIDEENVPDGPWKKIITTTQVNYH